MSLLAKSTKRILAPVGQHIARCYGVIDLGLQYSEKYKNYSNKVLLMWELPNALMADGRPFTYNANFNNTFGNKKKRTNFYKVLESWRGKSFSDKEQDEFQLEKLIGVPAFITLGKSADGEYVNHISIIKLPEGLQCPPAINKPYIFDLSNYSPVDYEILPDWIKKIINLEKNQEEENKADPESIVTTAMPDDDIPF